MNPNLNLPDGVETADTETQGRGLLLEQYKRMAEDSNRLIYTISHDLKGPLHTIKGFAELMEQDIAQGRTTTLAEDLKRVSDAADRMQRLIEGVLAVSRVTTNSTPPADVALPDLVADALKALEGTIRRLGVTVTVAPDLPLLFGDRVRLGLMLFQALDNACKFLGNPKSPSIEIGLRADGETHVFFVRDNGIGISPEEIPSLFSIFKKIDPTSPGVGVGLILIKRIVETHGGRVWLESAGLGQGSTLFFSFPKPPVAD